MHRLLKNFILIENFNSYRKISIFIILTLIKNKKEKRKIFSHKIFINIFKKFRFPENNFEKLNFHRIFSKISIFIKKYFRTISKIYTFIEYFRKFNFSIFQIFPFPWIFFKILGKFSFSFKVFENVRFS